jgi:hypothetical protein
MAQVKNSSVFSRKIKVLICSEPRAWIGPKTLESLFSKLHPRWIFSPGAFFLNFRTYKCIYSHPSEKQPSCWDEAVISGEAAGENIIAKAGCLLGLKQSNAI